MDASACSDFSVSGEREWIQTNGLGGWSSSTVSGCSTRRYHGLLVAATHPPTERMVLVSSLDETLVTTEGTFELATHQYNDKFHPEGYRCLESFRYGDVPEFIFSAGGVRLSRQITMLHGMNTVVIRYELLDAAGPVTIEWRPLLAGRYYHALMKANDNVSTHSVFQDAVWSSRLYPNLPRIFIGIPGCSFFEQPDWYYGFSYAKEAYRGLDHREDLFSPGKFTRTLAAGEIFYISIGTGSPEAKDPAAAFEAEITRKQGLMKDLPADRLFRQLALAADQFIVERTLSPSTGSDAGNTQADGRGATVIAGYHWFTDWSRDTMISLPGLTLSCGRYEPAKKILTAFSHHVSRGMLPNRFTDNNDAPEYNTVDGTLWYFVAVYHYLEATGDRDFVVTDLLPILLDIVEWHRKGTRYHIKTDRDSLLFAGEAGEQLTWMDARVGDWVVTPRTGKPVEVQALWYNALCIVSRILAGCNRQQEADDYIRQAALTKKNFVHKFWYEAGGYCYDVIEPGGKPDASFRPNQLFAVSLPFPLLEIGKASSMLKLITKELYTPAGLRSLSPKDPRYCGHYGGDRKKRDGAYHEGTVWSWLLGPYVDAIMKTDKARGKAKALAVVNAFSPHLAEAGVGSVSEIFDGDPPHHPRGCIAQAWGVAELLRVMHTYKLFDFAAAGDGGNDP